MNLQGWVLGRRVHPVTACRRFREGKLPVPALSCGRLILVRPDPKPSPVGAVVVHCRVSSAGRKPTGRATPSTTGSPTSAVMACTSSPAAPPAVAATASQPARSPGSSFVASTGPFSEPAGMTGSPHAAPAKPDVAKPDVTVVTTFRCG